MTSIPLLTIDNYNIDNEEPIGIIIKHSLSLKIFIDKKDMPSGKWVVTNFSPLLGGKSILLTRSVNDAIEDVKEKFISELTKKYPNATSVVNLKINLSRTFLKYQILPTVIATMSGTVIGPK